jgi:cation:H+ antiporter
MALGVGLVVVGVEGLLRVALGLGDLLGTASFLWGATVVAAATSVPDAIISIRSARRGEGEVSAGNVLGSNIFDLLVAIPAGVLVAGATVVDYRIAAPLVAFLTLATVTLFATLRTSLRLDPREGWALLGLYVCFVAWLGLETAGVTDLLGGG